MVCIRHVMESNIIKPNFPTELTYKVLDIADSVEQNIIQFLPQTRAFIDEALQSQVKIGIEFVIDVSCQVSRGGVSDSLIIY